jgi:hypothetical protein
MPYAPVSANLPPVPPAASRVHFLSGSLLDEIKMMLLLSLALD